MNGAGGLGNKIPDNLLIEAYHKIILQLECPKVSGNSNFMNRVNTISDPYYYLEYDEILEFLNKRLKLHKNDAILVIKELVERGFLVPLPDDYKHDISNVTKYRSLHMDVLIRSAHIRTAWDGIPYIVSPRFLVYYMDVPSEDDYIYMPSVRAAQYNIVTGFLRNAILKFFDNEDLASSYVEILRTYLSKYLQSKGLDAYQAYSLARMLSSDKDVYVIIAPTGAGKTEIFLFYILARLMRAKHHGENRNCVIIYPRKMLQVDQSERMLQLLYVANDYLKKKFGYEITFGLRDGDTPRDDKEKDNEPYRGIKCPICSGTLLYREGNVKCEKCKNKFHFIMSTRPSLGGKNPDILVTNMWALEVRVMDNNKSDINVNAFKNLDAIVVDETHEYTGIRGGIVRALLEILKDISKIESPKIIISSATIPNPREFSSKITGVHDNNIELHSYKEVYDELGKHGISPSGKRLVIVGLFSMNPKYSWSTYCQLWSVMMAFLNYVYGLDDKEYTPQSIIFINNKKELNRTFQGFKENISLGEPQDHVRDILRGVKLESIDPYAYWHYASPSTRISLKKLFDSGNKLDLLADKVTIMHSEISEEDRRSIIAAFGGSEEKHKSIKDLAVVLSTSSLELGVDYKNVSFILNVGLEKSISLAQRIGRGGRSKSSLRTVLGIILTRNIPSEELLINSPEIVEILNPSPTFKDIKLPVAYSNPQVIKRGIFIKTLSKLARMGYRTYASVRSMSRKNDLEDLIDIVIKSLENVEEWGATP